MHKQFFFFFSRHSFFCLFCQKGVFIHAIARNAQRNDIGLCWPLGRQRTTEKTLARNYAWWANVHTTIYTALSFGLLFFAFPPFALRRIYRPTFQQWISIWWAFSLETQWRHCFTFRFGEIRIAREADDNDESDKEKTHFFVDVRARVISANKVHNRTRLCVCEWVSVCAINENADACSNFIINNNNKAIWSFLYCFANDEIWY